MQLEIKTKSGCVYKRVAWMGGSSAPENVKVLGPDFLDLVIFFFEEQIKDFTDHWGDFPNADTREIFWGRAVGDAWRTYSEKFGKTDNNISSQWR